MLGTRRWAARLALWLAGAALLAVTGCGPQNEAAAPAAPAVLTELRIGTTATEADPARVQTLKAYEAYLAEKIGMPVRLFNASDYAGVAQAMEAEQIELAFVGPSNYAGMYLRMGDKIRPILAPKDADYFSIMYVRADSAFQSIEDLKGKTLAFSDVNSASGYLIPSQLLRKEGRDPATFFGGTIFGGGHEQAIIAVLRGQADAGVTWSSLQGSHESGYSYGAPRSMVNAGLLDMSDIRIVWRGGPIPPGPIVANVSRISPELLGKIVEAHLALATERPDILKLLVSGDAPGYAATGPEAYAEIVELRRLEEAARRAR